MLLKGSMDAEGSFIDANKEALFLRLQHNSRLIKPFNYFRQRKASELSEMRWRLTVWNWIVSSLLASSRAKKDLLWVILLMSFHLQKQWRARVKHTTAIYDLKNTIDTAGRRTAFWILVWTSSDINLYICLFFCSEKGWFIPQ